MSFSATFAIFALVFVVWLTTFQLNSERIENKEIYDQLSPLASLKEMTARFADDMKGGFSEIGDLFSETDDPVDVTSSSDINTAAVNDLTEYEFFEGSLVGTTTKDEDYLYKDTKDEVLYGASDDDQIQEMSGIDDTATGSIDEIDEGIVTE